MLAAILAIGGVWGMGVSGDEGGLLCDEGEVLGDVDECKGDLG